MSPFWTPGGLEPLAGGLSAEELDLTEHGGHLKIGGQENRRAGQQKEGEQEGEGEQKEEGEQE